jgi:hypothetical protein
MAGPVPAIPIVGALCAPDQDRRDKPGDDESAAMTFAALTNEERSTQYPQNFASDPDAHS